MSSPRIAPYGSWRSSISAQMIVGGGLRFGGTAHADGAWFWTEGRASEGGRNVLVRRSASGDIVELTPPPFDVRTRVHEYGGGAFTVTEGAVWFVNFADQQIYTLSPEQSDHVDHAGGGGWSAPRPLTHESALRFADLVPDLPRNRLLAVIEDHREAGEPENYLGSIDLDRGTIKRLADGHDFFSSAVLHPRGDRVAWLTWDHPRMPWDGTELWVAPIEADGELGPKVKVAGGTDQSVFQPAWSPEGVLYFVNDPTGWWNLYRVLDDVVTPVHEGPRELGRPQWGFGMRTYGFDGVDVVCAYCEDGRWYLGRIRAQAPASAPPEPIALPYEDFGTLTFGRNEVLFTAGSPDRVGSLVRCGLRSGELEELRCSSSLQIPAERISVPRSIRYPTSEGDEAHALFYGPHNPDFVGPEEARPPLIVIGHGGPTGATSATLSPAVQYWTSRGFAVLDVNYRGSTGYGRAYRDRLKEQWGVFDVADCVHGAQFLVSAGEVDPKRLAIRGGSAGGYTALAALTFHDVFTAGASYYGIGELEALARDTHKFESRYLDQLIGPYPAMRERYHERSPIHFTERLSCPVIFFQGLEDKIVPPNQAEMMVEALRAKGVPVAYLSFPGEQHGFRAAATIKRTLEAELYFYSRIFDFVAADELEPVDIQGL